jgi:hypothetical protein
VGAWDPTGTRIAAARYDNASPYEASLVIIDPESSATQPLGGPQGVGYINWLPEGIVFTVSHARQPGAEVMLLPTKGGTAVSIYKDANSIQRIDVIRP